MLILLLNLFCQLMTFMHNFVMKSQFIFVGSSYAVFLPIVYPRKKGSTVVGIIVVELYWILNPFPLPE